MTTEELTTRVGVESLLTITVTTEPLLSKSVCTWTRALLQLINVFFLIRNLLPTSSLLFILHEEVLLNTTQLPNWDWPSFPVEVCSFCCTICLGFFFRHSLFFSCWECVDISIGEISDSFWVVAANHWPDHLLKLLEEAGKNTDGFDFESCSSGFETSPSHENTIFQKLNVLSNIIWSV